MGEKDKATGSEPTDTEAARPAVPRQGPLRRFANLAGGEDNRTIFQPFAGRRAGLRRPAGPSADATAEPQKGTAAPPRRATQEAADLNVTHDNPIMQAASPLLLLFGRLRTSLIRAPAATLAPQITQSIARAESEMLAAGVSSSVAERAKYCLCVAADEVLTNLPGSSATSTGSIVRHFFGERLKSDRFLETIAAGASDQPDLLELQHACLAVVFVGNSRVVGADAAALQTARRDIYQRLQQSGPAVRDSLSPHWRGLALPAPGVRLQIPFWAITGIVGLLLFALYLMLRALLGLQAESVAHTMRTLTPQVSFAARDSATPPAPLPPTPTQASQLERIRKVLADSIAAGNLSVEPTPNQIIIRIPDRVIFPPERTTILDDFLPIAQKISLAVDREQGAVKVIGNTDDTPIAGGRYASNFQFSFDRAKAVAAVIRRSLSQPDRVTTEAKGADAPLASNDTAEGRAKNRRIEIIIARSD